MEGQTQHYTYRLMMAQVSAQNNVYLVPSPAGLGSIVVGFHTQISRFSHGHIAHLTPLLLLAHQAVTFHNILGK